MSKKLICIGLVLAILCSICTFAIASSHQYGVLQLKNLALYDNEAGTITSSVQQILGALTGRYTFNVSRYKVGERQFHTPMIRARFNARGFIGSGDFNEHMSFDASRIITEIDYAIGTTNWASMNNSTVTTDTSKCMFQFSMVSSIKLLGVYVSYRNSNGSTIGSRVYKSIDNVATANGLYYQFSFPLDEQTGWSYVIIDFVGETYKRLGLTSSYNWGSDNWEISIDKTLVPFWQPKTPPSGQTTIPNVTPNYSGDLTGLVRVTSIIADYFKTSVMNQNVQINEIKQIEYLMEVLSGQLSILDSDFNTIYNEIDDFLVWQIQNILPELQTINSNLNTIKSNLSTIGTNIALIKSDIDAIDTNVSNISTNVALMYSTVSSGLSTINGTLSTASGTLTSIYGEQRFHTQMLTGIIHSISDANSYLSDIADNTGALLDWAEDFEIEINGETSNGKSFMESIFGFVKTVFGAFAGFVGGIFSYSIVNVIDDFDGSEVFGSDE